MGIERKYNFDPRKSQAGTGRARERFDRTTWEGERESQMVIRPAVQVAEDSRHPFSESVAKQVDPVLFERTGRGSRSVALAIAAFLSEGGNPDDLR